MLQNAITNMNAYNNNINKICKHKMTNYNMLY